MKKLILATAFFFITQIIYSQSGWVWINPYVTGNHLNDVFFTNSTTAFVIGEAGMILRTTNSGDRWDYINNTTPASLREIFFVNEKTGYIVGANGSSGTLPIILHSSDAGITWDAQSPGNYSYNLSTIYFVNGMVGYAAGPGGVIKTTNSGSNWFNPTSQNLGTCEILGSHFVDENTGFLTGVCSTYAPPLIREEGYYWRTTDGGLNWSVDTLPNANALYRVKFITHDNGFILGNDGLLFFTSDCGLNWVSIPSNCTDDLADISFDGAKNGMIAAANGWILITTDAGMNWNVKNNTSQTNKGISLKSNNCIIVGPWGLLRHSTNSGAQWTNHHRGILPMYEDNIFYDACFVNSSTGFAVGTFSTRIYRTTNAGKDWSYQYTPQGIHYAYNIQFTDMNTGFVPGRYGYVAKTTNGGLNWISIDMNVSWEYSTDLFFLNSFTGYITNEYGKVCKTIDGGENWAIVLNHGSTHFNKIFFLNSEIGCVVGDGPGGTILRTTNAGMNWFEQSSGLSGDLQLKGIYLMNSETGFIACHEGKILRTSNGGNNWVIVYSAYCTLNDIAFKDPMNGIVVGGPNGLIVRTTNGGLNWVKDQSYTINTLYGCSYSAEYGEVAVGSCLTILRNNSTPVGIKKIYTEIPKTYFLSQNYPNPFNPTTKIKFSIPLSPLYERGAGGFVTLKVYDLLGRELAVLVNESIKPGSYEVEWDGTNYPSGVYFYRLSTGDYNETKRMVLLK